MIKARKNAVIAFVPVLHKGYLEFFRKSEGDIWIFSSELINENVHLTRDVRTIDPKDIVSVSIMPCTAKKFEANREEMSTSGVSDVDVTITTKELAKL